MPYKETEIKIKTQRDQGSIFDDDYKANYTTEISKTKYGNSHFNGHLNSSISITPLVNFKLFVYLCNVIAEKSLS